MDYGALNSATKYPSIDTYHGLDPSNGSLIEDEVTRFGGSVVLTEKVDGTNGRIVLMPGGGDWFIGSREELLYARGDRIENPALGIVETLKPVISEGRLEGRFPTRKNLIQVFYLEVYGHRIGQGARQYTTEGRIGYRLFDIATVPVEVLSWPREKIASWRDHGGQQWASEAELLNNSARLPLTPRLRVVNADELPSDIEGMAAFIRRVLPKTEAALDASALGAPEGIVLRSDDRRTIAKAKFQDYARTLKRRGKAGA